MRKTVHGLWLTVALLLLLTAPAAAAYIRIDILSVNDYHGALSETAANPGAAKLAGWLRAEKAKNPAGTLLVSAGDMLQGSADANLLQGKPVIALMNAVGFDAMALGNHEFDWGLDTLQARSRQAKFPFLAANVLERRTQTVPGFAKPYVIVNKQGVRVALVGLITPETAYKSSPDLVDRLEFGDPADAFRALLPELRRQADIIVVVSHLGGAVDAQTGALSGEAAEFLAGSDGVDALITGHTHQGYALKSGTVPVVQARHHGRAVGKISLVYSATANRILASTAALIELEPEAMTADAAVAGLLAAAKAEAEPVRTLVLGSSARPLPHDRRQLSPLGQWAAEVMRRAAGADIALQHGGGLRRGIAAGPVTLGDLYEVVPFDNQLVTVELSGRQILELLEYGIRNEAVGMLQFAGIKVVFDAALPAGSRVVAATLTDGRPLQPAEVYKVAVNDFMAAGGDGYSLLKEAGKPVVLPLLLRDALAAAIREQSPVDFTADDRLNEVFSIARPPRPAA